MKKLIAFGVFALALSVGTACAQIGKVGIGLAGTGQLPVGNFSDVVGVGVGGLGDVEVGMYPGLALVARSGYIYHFETSRTSYFHQIPIMGGAKFTVPATPVYIAGDLGAVLVKEDFKTRGVTLSHSDNPTNFGWDAGIGSNVGPVDLRLTFNVLDASNMTNSMTIGLSLGFTAWSI